RLSDLNARAGGALGAPIAVPQLATLARLAKRLGILVSRSVIAADGDHDLELWVRAMPTTDDGGVTIHITGWRARLAWTPGADEQDRAMDFVRTAASWVWETDAALKISYISIGAGARHGFDSTALIGQPLTKLFALGEDERGDFPILNALAMHERFDSQPARLRFGGQPVELSATPRFDASGGFTGFFGATTMIEARAPRDRLLPEAGEGAVAALPDAFAGRLDKALRAPLGRIIANADSISAQSEGPLRQDYADYASDIATAGRHLLGLIDDLVDLNAIERPDFTTTPEPIDMADVARRAAGLLAVRAQTANVRIDKPTEIDALPATGEFRRALQVLVNLVGNAVRYSPDGGMVWLRTERDGDHAAVIVADQGRGIALADQERIFEKFERVDPSETGGSGLGLYIARRLARAMGGDVTVDSAPGMGARFVFTLPYRDA
ncbi:MAG: ATP-binding protein, partial [Sphingomonas sp.]